MKKTFAIGITDKQAHAAKMVEMSPTLNSNCNRQLVAIQESTEGTLKVMEIVKVGEIYKGQNGQVYSPEGISPTLRSGETANPDHGGIGSSNSPKILLTQETSTQSPPQKSQTTTSSSEDFLAKLSASLEIEEDSKIQEVLSFLKLPESSKIKDLHIYSSKTSKDCLAMTMAGHSKQSCGRLMNWGMTHNGRFLTARITESPRIGKECSLSDILEENPDPKYFLSEKATMGILRHKENHKAKGNGFGATIFQVPSTPDSGVQPEGNSSYPIPLHKDTTREETT